MLGCLVGLVVWSLAPAHAWAQISRGSVVGFGGMPVSGAAFQPTFGGGVSVALTPNIHAIGEVGRVSDVMNPTVDRLSSLTTVDLDVSAFYGEGGVRFLTGVRGPLRGYVETTAGFARLSTRLHGIESVDAYVNGGLAFFDRTSPMLGLGGGVQLLLGPAVLDVGYRYKRIVGDGTLDRVLTGGNSINMSQMRVGVGYRF